MSDFVLVAVAGYYGAGKDVYADALVDYFGFEKTFMSKFLHKCLQTVNPWILLDKQIDVDGFPYAVAGSFTKYDRLEAVVGYVGAKEQREVREWLQVMGTEVGRNILGEDTWVRLMREELQRIKDSGRNAVLTRVQYENELALIHEFGGRTVWISRPGFEPKGETAEHSSERTLSPADFDFQVMNDGEKKDLEKKAVAQTAEWLTLP